MTSVFHRIAREAEPLLAGEIRHLARNADAAALATAARSVRDAGFGTRLTYSRKVFVPLTQLCRDVCHYCTFAKAPRRLPAPYMSVEEVLQTARAGAAAGCKEALFTLGERPELRYQTAAQWLAAHGHASTIAYVAHAAKIVRDETGLLPHVNAGTLSDEEIALLRPVSGSMGIMLESAAERLCGRGMPHHGSPDKAPEARLATLARLGAQRVPTTTGLLIGIGETEEERIDALLLLRDLHRRYGHLQEVIIQNFRAKPGTRMARHPEPSTEELVRAVALARLVFGAELSVQVPPNLNAGALDDVVDAGVDDWGGISPVTPDFVNPEAPWPHLEALSRDMDRRGMRLVERLTLHPRFAEDAPAWADAEMRPFVLRHSDGESLGRDCGWRAGGEAPPPRELLDRLAVPVASGEASRDVARIVERSETGRGLAADELERLFAARGPDLAYVCQAADRLRQDAAGDVVTYVVTRNINYTNVCSYGCRFCAFSKGKTSDALRGAPYDLKLEEIARRVREAWDRGATEVCMQGGIHPAYTGNTYLSILRAVKEASPSVHVHAFSPLEVTQGARTLGLSVERYLVRLKESGLGSLPGTAAEVLDDEVRAVICPDKLSTDEWLSVIETAHRVGLRTTATIMFGHVDSPVHWARHLTRIRALQDRTGGFTEFVPLPFVAAEAPMFLKGLARPGPTFREAVLMHAVARLAFHDAIPNIQASWVKLGRVGVEACLRAGVNDLGGTLMNESITRAAGAVHGQEAAPETLEGWIKAAGREPRQRTTLYGAVREDRRSASFEAPPLAPLVNDALEKRSKSKGEGAPRARTAADEGARA